MRVGAILKLKALIRLIQRILLYWMHRSLSLPRKVVSWLRNNHVTSILSLRLGLRDETSLLSLPLEVLAMILGELCLQDVLRARKTCKSFYAASKSRLVWLSLYERLSASYDCPLPFKNNVSSMTTDQLELAITKWARVDAGWTSEARRPIRRTLGLCGETWLYLVPGGRWLLALCNNSCLKAYDLDLNRQVILIRPNDRREQISFGEMTVFVSNVTPKVELYIALSHTVSQPSRLAIWKVYESEGLDSLQACHVTSFNTYIEDSDVSALSADYFVTSSQSITIFDWKNSSSLQHRKVDIQPEQWPRDMAILPNSRILVLRKKYVTIYNIPPLSFTSAFGPPSGPQAMNPLHTIAFPVDIIAPTIPFYITTSGTTKILLGNPGGAHWLSIPREDDESASTAFAISFPSRFYWFVGGLHRGFARSTAQAEAITFLLTDNKPPPMAVGEWMADSDLEPFGKSILVIL
ncbi:hypothetical protein AB1N83_003418 [Pleurotus pulmonarius]